MNQDSSPSRPGVSRRSFLTSAAFAGIAGPALLSSRSAFAANSDTIRIGLVGCGGRGSGAAGNALAADANTVLVAMGDAFPEPVPRAAKSLQAQFKDRIQVTPEKQFVGLDAYQKVIDAGVDVVLLASPPGFRPVHLRAAVEAGKHIFCEKPMATDAAGVRSVMESVRMSKARNRCLVAGFCWRYDRPRVEFYRRILDGAIGDIRAVHATYYTGPVKPMPAPEKRPAGMGDLEWQARNWYNFVWLSGDGYVEQAIHSVDKVAWVMRDVPPLWAVGNGGRTIPNNEGNIYDHMDVTYEYAGGVKAFLGQRQITGCFSENSDYIWGSKSQGIIDGRGPMILGDSPWRYDGEGGNMYDLEHVALFEAIRAGRMLNDGDRMATSTLMGIMGRMAAYTGQKVTWEQALNAKDDLVPEKLSWDMKLPVAPMAMPGRTKIG